MRRIRYICGGETNRQMQVPELFENRYYEDDELVIAHIFHQSRDYARLV